VVTVEAVDLILGVMLLAISAGVAGFCVWRHVVPTARD
jgi:hypothetical protein